MRNKISFFPLCFLFLLTCSLSSCWGFFSRPYNGSYAEPKKWAWKPVYSLDTSYRNVSYEDPRTVVNAGKIYVKDNLIYQCETGEGIHVTDNTDPAVAKRIGFLKVPGCEEISIKGNILYTNNYYDLIAIDITNLATSKVISRTRNVFYGDSGMPHSWEQPKDSGYFQCPNYYSDSVIVNWVKDSVFADCYKAGDGIKHVSRINGR